MMNHKKKIFSVFFVIFVLMILAVFFYIQNKGLSEAAVSYERASGKYENVTDLTDLAVVQDKLASIKEDIKMQIEEKENQISITVLGKETLVIDKDRIHEDVYGDYLDNKWSIEEIDAILNSLKGTWQVDQYVGFVYETLYFGDLFDHNDNLEQEKKELLYLEYQKDVEYAKKNIPEISFSIRERRGRDTTNNYIYTNGGYGSPISIILSTDRKYDYYPAFVDRTTFSDGFLAEYPVLYIKFFVQTSKNGVGKYEPATLVITDDNQFYFLKDGAFYSIKEVTDEE